MKKFENGEITLANGTKLVIETRSLVGRPDTPDSPICYSYPTMVKLAHNGENNGKLIAILNEALPAVLLAEVTELIIILYTFAVSEMVVDIYGNTLVAKH